MDKAEKRFLTFLAVMDGGIWLTVFFIIGDGVPFLYRIIIPNLFIIVANVIVSCLNLAGVTGRVEDWLDRQNS